MTAEDPVEFNFDGINQVLVKQHIGLTFAASLRSFLRQDPDIIMVGEIRDTETAEIGIRAALTGHLVFSTLHTNDAPSTISRLTDMGIPPFLVASATKLIMAQRMIRKICQSCKQEIEVDPERLIRLGVPENEVGQFPVFEGRGCNECNGTGMSGRTGIFEVMPISGTVEKMILDRVSVPDIRRQACEEGMLTLRQAALMKLKRGLTNVQEVMATSAGGH
jgi:type IV pilus assembly protein PilB